MLCFQLIPDSGPVLVDQLQSIGAFVIWLSVFLGAVLFVATVFARLLRFRGVGHRIGRRSVQVWRVFFPVSRTERRRREVAEAAVVAITPLIGDMRGENDQHHAVNAERLSGIEHAVLAVKGELESVNSRIESLEDVVTHPSPNGDVQHAHEHHQPPRR